MWRGMCPQDQKNCKTFSEHWKKLCVNRKIEKGEMTIKMVSRFLCGMCPQEIFLGTPPRCIYRCHVRWSIWPIWPILVGCVHASVFYSKGNKIYTLKFATDASQLVRPWENSLMMWCWIIDKSTLLFYEQLLAAISIGLGHHQSLVFISR